MRRLVVYLMVGQLMLATAVPSMPVCAQEPWQELPPVRIETRDITPYMVGLGAIMGVVAFNIAAPAVSAWYSSAVTSVTNIRSVLWATGQVAAGVPAATAGAAAQPAAAAAAGPVVQPLTQTMMAQAQILGTAAAASGAIVVNAVYKTINWLTGAAP